MSENEAKTDPGEKSDSATRTANINKRATIIVGILGLLGVVTAAVISKLPSAPPTSTPTPAPTLTPTPLPSFTGRIFEERTDKAIRKAKVSLEGEGVPPYTYTDSEGTFAFPATDPNKEITLRIDAVDYEQYVVRVIPAKYTGIKIIYMTPKPPPNTLPSNSPTRAPGQKKPSPPVGGTPPQSSSSSSPQAGTTMLERARKVSTPRQER